MGTRTKDVYASLISEQKCLDKFRIGSGCCIICFNPNPLVLEEHHLFGAANSDVTITVCANHHVLFSRMQGRWPAGWLRKTPDHPVFIQALLDTAVQDLLKVHSDYWNGRDFIS